MSEEQTGQKSEAQEKAEDAKQQYEQARETIKEWEEKDSEDLPTDLTEWPDDQAKYQTFGGPEGDHGYDEGPETKLGPSEVRHHEDGKVTVGGEEADPDDYRGEPIPGGPTDPEAPELAGEKRKREKRERMGTDPASRGEGDGDD
ncbi:MAG TPA: hypothetical protein VHR88_10165 [Solirubrobacteraceae bacterium]|nr:hypothetical protein [Solirubrobacteraceae bacterium]